MRIDLLRHRAFTRVTALTSLFVFFIGLLPIGLVPSTVSAAGPTLIISEVNWAGSKVGATAYPDDDWIELQNVSLDPISFNLDPYILTMDTGNGPVTIATIDEGTIYPGKYFLLTVAGTNLSPSLQLTTDQTLTLPIEVTGIPSTPVLFTLTAEGETVPADVAGSLTGTVPFAGNSCAPAAIDCTISSMIRLETSVSGSTSSAWRSSHIIGSGFEPTVEQFGTPSTSDFPTENTAALDAPTATAIEPVAPTYLDTPTVSGTAAIPAVDVVVSFYDVEKKVIAAEETATVQSDTSFIVTVPGNHALAPGTYRVTAYSIDPDLNRSERARIPVPGSADGLYTVLSVPLTIDAVPTATNQASTHLTGTTAPGATVTYSLNGAPDQMLVLANGVSRFDIPLTLVDGANSVTIVARIGVKNTSTVVTVSTTLDTSAPVAIALDHLILTANAPGTADTVAGLAGAGEPGNSAQAYAEGSLTTLIASGPIESDGSFAALSIGDNVYSRVYLVQRDAAGNVSPATVLDNPIKYFDSNLTIPTSIGTTGTDRVTISWEPVTGAEGYRIRYRAIGGGFGNPLEFCTASTPCGYTTTIIGLNPDTEYVFAIAAVDRYGNESGYSEQQARTRALPVAVSQTTVPKVAAPVTPPVPRSTATPTPTATPTATATPTPSESPGEVKSTTDESEASRNWTPWIILAVLIALAVLATAGYFYWFGGEAGEAALSSAQREREARQREDEEAEAKPESKPEKPRDDRADRDDEEPPKRSPRDRRW